MHVALTAPPALPQETGPQRGEVFLSKVAQGVIGVGRSKTQGVRPQAQYLSFHLACPHHASLCRIL